MLNFAMLITNIYIFYGLKNGLCCKLQFFNGNVFKFFEFGDSNDDSR